MAGAVAINDMYASMMGAQPAFVFTTQDLLPPTTQLQQQGSPMGVPPPMNIAGQSAPDTASGSTSSAWAVSVGARNPANHPIFWSTVLLCIGVLGLAWVAHLEVRRR